MVLKQDACSFFLIAPQQFANVGIVPLSRRRRFIKARQILASCFLGRHEPLHQIADDRRSVRRCAIRQRPRREIRQQNRLPSEPAEVSADQIIHLHRRQRTAGQRRSRLRGVGCSGVSTQARRQALLCRGLYRPSGERVFVRPHVQSRHQQLRPADAERLRQRELEPV